MNILGMSYMYHDSAAALVRDGEILAAAAEERFLRAKHTTEFPVRAIEYVLQAGGTKINDLDAVVFYEKPFLKFERILKSHLMVFPHSYASFRRFLPMWLNYKLRVPDIIRERTGYRGKVYFTDHHYAHAASAFLTSPYERAIVLTTDGTGEWSTLAYGVGEGTKIRLDRDIRFPHSLGLLYSAVTAHLGFTVNEGEGKVMGLASYGKPRFRKQFEQIIKLFDDGSFQLNMDCFSFHYDLVMTNERFAKLLIPGRTPESELREEHYDLAATLQVVIEEALERIVIHAHKQYGIDTLVMAGGVALNCVANGKILERTPIKHLHVQPASGDDGGALGSALYLYTQRFGGKNRPTLTHAYLGPEYDNAEVEAALRARNAPFTRMDEPALLEFVARSIAEGKIIGWFQGRMEYGPRSLGNRSILADARNPKMKDIVNARVKHREGFRPFAPAVPLEHAQDWFATDQESPFMLLAVPVRPDKADQIPSITHVDGTARLQTVTEASNARFYRLLKEFGSQTGVPVILNTSFNLRGEPMVCTPTDAFECFARTNMDMLVIGDYVVHKSALPGGIGG
jgi:carbamoyltransferase